MLLIFFSYFQDLRAINVKNDDFAPTLKTIWSLGPGHQRYINIIYNNNINENFSSTLKSIWPLRPSH